VKSYRKRIAKDAKLVAQYKARVGLFKQGVRGAPINDHILTGRLAGYCAFSITSDVRVVYVETARAFVFMDIGTHNQVYGQ
jgi:mRNA-degrading endonuclease YafQ of YafQ-DinJ toxin-antitoxin module